jgi:hypothetical protein
LFYTKPSGGNLNADSTDLKTIVNRKSSIENALYPIKCPSGGGASPACHVRNRRICKEKIKSFVYNIVTVTRVLVEEVADLFYIGMYIR